MCFAWSEQNNQQHNCPQVPPSFGRIVLMSEMVWGFFCFLVFFCFMRPNVQHMEVPRLSVKSQLQLLAYITATAMQNPSYICSLHHSSWQHRVLNPWNEARVRTYILMDIVGLITLSHNGNFQK